MTVMGKHLSLLILLMNLHMFSTTYGDLDFKALINSNNSDESTILKNLLMHTMQEMKELKLQLNSFVRKDELPQLVKNITSVADPPHKRTDDTNSSSYLNNQNRMDTLKTSIEAPVASAVNMSTMDQMLKLVAQFANVRRSCHEWLTSGFKSSGIYNVDPDGVGTGEPPIQVYCDMVTGFTFLRHDKESIQEATSCTGSMCYKRKLNYEASETQLTTLIMMSQRCQQFMKVDCLESPFQTEEGPLAWWKGRDGLQHYEWAGEEYPNHICNCGFSSSCVNPMKPCNCDADISKVWVSDSGYISNHTALPVQEVVFGTKDSYTPLQVKYSIGPLRCYGFRSDA